MSTNSFFGGKKGGILLILVLTLSVFLCVTSGQAGNSSDSGSELAADSAPAPDLNSVQSAALESQPSSSDNVYIDLNDLNQTSKPTSESLSNLTTSVSDLNNSSNETYQASNNTSAVLLNESTIPIESKDSNYNYVDLNLINNQTDQTNQADQTNSSGTDSANQIDYVLYKNNKKTLETTAYEGENPTINTAEVVVDNENWKKDVKVYSDKHIENPVTIYADIPENESGKVEVFWREGHTFLNYTPIDTDANGIADRISWVVPHLSEQNFEISMLSDLSLATDNSTMGQIIITSPSFTSNVSSPSVLLAFMVNDTNGSSPVCNFTLLKNGNSVMSTIFVTSTVAYNVSVDNGFYSWNVSCSDQTSTNSSTGNFAVSISSTPQVGFASSSTVVNRGASATFFINISASISPIQYALDFGDGSTAVNPGVLNVNSVSTSISHSYQAVGSYTAVLTVFVAGNSYQRSVPISVTNNADTTNPQISMINPLSNDEIDNTSVDFSYRATDNVYVANCTLSIYFYNSSLLGNLVYSSVKTNVDSQTVNISLQNFDYGDYSWDVTCYDNSSNSADESRDFSILNPSNQSSLTVATSANALNLSEEDQQTVNTTDDLISKINDFTAKESSYDIKAKEAISDIGIDEKMANYKKILIQIKQDVSYNLGYMTDDSLRQNRKKQIQDQINEIKGNVPTDLTVDNAYDYYKTESKADITSILQNYVKVQGLSVNDASLAAMTDYLTTLQESAIVSNNAKTLKITYPDRSDDITLISKSVEVKNDSFSSIIENIPAKVSTSEIVFITKSKSIDNQNFQIQESDLTNGKIIYYIKEGIPLKSVEDTNSVLFTDEALTLKLNGISGFVTSLRDGNYGQFGLYFGWFVFISLAILGGTYYVKQASVSRFANDNPEFGAVLSKIKNANTAINIKDFELAKDDYRAIKSDYLKLPEKAKQIVYKKVKALQIELDRKEAISLAKEFLSAAKQNRKEDARLIYKKIKLIYPRLLEKDKTKIFSKIDPYIRSLSS